MAPTSLALINPASGNADPDAVEAALRARVLDLEVRRLPRQGDLIDFVREQLAALRPQGVIASGGDGTISAVASAMRDRPVPLTVIPTGTANLLARELNIPLDPIEACELAAPGEVRAVDVMQLNTRWCMCRLGLGQIAEVGTNTDSSAKQRSKNLAYVARALPRIIETSDYGFELEIDGEPISAKASSIVITSVGVLGIATLSWSREIRLDDGVIDVMIVEANTPLERLSVLLGVAEGNVTHHDDVKHVQAHRSIVIRTRGDTPIVADGEVLRSRSLEVSVVPHALPVRVPV